MKQICTTVAVFLVLAGALIGCGKPPSNDVPAASETAPPTVDAGVETTPVPAAPPETQEPPVETDELEPPHIKFDSTVYDFGAVSEVAAHRAVIRFVNDGGQTLLVRDVKTTCGCAVGKLPKKEIAPGESGTLEIAFEPTAPGKQRKYATVFSNSEPIGQTRITIEADVQAFMKVEPNEMKLGTLRLGEEHRYTVLIACQDEAFQLISCRASHPIVQARVIPDNELGVVAGISGWETTKAVEVILPKDAPWGPFHGWLEINGRGRTAPDLAPITHQSRIRLNGHLFGELSADPDTYRFGVAPNEDFERRIELRRDGGAPFQITGTEISGLRLQGAEIRVDPIGTNAFALTLVGNAGPDMQRHSGRVIVHTDVPGEETIEIPVSGITRTTPRSP